MFQVLNCSAQQIEYPSYPLEQTGLTGLPCTVIIIIARRHCQCDNFNMIHTVTSHQAYDALARAIRFRHALTQAAK
jgi:hypothetical protein